MNQEELEKILNSICEILGLDSSPENWKILSARVLELRELSLFNIRNRIF